MIEINHLHKDFGNAVPFKDLTCKINEGDIVSIIGPSGTGKSTLLRCINMLTAPTSGRIFIDGVEVTAPDCNINEIRKKVGMVFQNFNLFEHLTVVENVMQAPIDLLGKSRTEAYKQAIELLRMVGMEGRAFNYPDMLSGGQKQRVAIARTLAMDPDYILFDEPTSALDPTMVGEVQSVIRELARQGKSMIIVTHEMQFAREICNRVFYLDEGGLYEEGTPEEIFEHPKKDKTRRFIRRLKVFEVSIDEKNHDFLGLNSELMQYAYKNMISGKMLYHLQAIFEELCQQILMPYLEKPQIEFTVEYDGENEVAEIIVKYNGPNFDPANTDNDISKNILMSHVNSIIYEETTDGVYTNKLEIVVK